MIKFREAGSVFGNMRMRHRGGRRKMGDGIFVFAGCGSEVWMVEYEKIGGGEARAHTHPRPLCPDLCVYYLDRSTT